MAGLELHGTIAGSGNINIQGDGAPSLHFAEIGVSLQGKLLAGTLDVRGSIPEADASPFTVGQAHMTIGTANARIKLGLQDTHFGYEPPNPAGFPFVSNSWLYNTGPVDVLEATLSIGNENFELSIGVNTNNWEAQLEGLDVPGVYSGLSLSVGGFSLLANLGLDPTFGGGLSMRTLLDIVVSWDLSDSVHLALNYDYAIDDNEEQNSVWQGGDLYLVYTPGGDNGWFQWANRVELFRDEDGFVSDNPDLFSLGLTMAFNFRLPYGFQIRADINQQVGLNDASPSSTTFSAMLLYSGSYEDPGADSK